MPQKTQQKIHCGKQQPCLRSPEGRPELQSTADKVVSQDKEDLGWTEETRNPFLICFAVKVNVPSHEQTHLHRVT